MGHPVLAADPGVLSICKREKGKQRLRLPFPRPSKMIEKNSKRPIDPDAASSCILCPCPDMRKHKEILR